jgi:hypothetical protein
MPGADTVMLTARQSRRHDDDDERRTDNGDMIASFAGA